MLADQQKQSTARLESSMENTNLSKQQQVSEIRRQMLTQAQTACYYYTYGDLQDLHSVVRRQLQMCIRDRCSNQGVIAQWLRNDFKRSAFVEFVTIDSATIANRLRSHSGANWLRSHSGAIGK